LYSRANFIGCQTINAKTSMNKHIKADTNKGEASIIFTFIILMIVMMGAFTISVISISTIKGSKIGENSALALYAADTGLEKGISDFWWGNGSCSSNNTSGTTIGSGTTYSLTIDNRGDGNTTLGTCPTITQLNDTGATSKLCIEAIGKSGGTERKLSSESGKSATAACSYFK